MSSHHELKQSTVKLLQTLQHNKPEMAKLYQLLGIQVSSKETTALKNITDQFRSPRAIITVGLLVKAYIVQKENERKFNTIVISSDAHYKLYGKGELKKQIAQDLTRQDFMPRPLSQKLALIEDIKTLKGEVYYRNKNGTLTTVVPDLTTCVAQEIDCDNVLKQFLD